jgi:hypothetical protein
VKLKRLKSKRDEYTWADESQDDSITHSSYPGELRALPCKSHEENSATFQIDLFFSNTPCKYVCFHRLYHIQMMDRDAKMMRGDGPTLFCQVKHNVGIPEMIELITEAYRAAAAKAAGQRVEEPSTKRTKH